MRHVGLLIAAFAGGVAGYLLRGDPQPDSLVPSASQPRSGPSAAADEGAWDASAPPRDGVAFASDGAASEEGREPEPGAWASVGTGPDASGAATADAVGAPETAGDTRSAPAATARAAGPIGPVAPRPTTPVLLLAASETRVATRVQRDRRGLRPASSEEPDASEGEPANPAPTCSRIVAGAAPSAFETCLSTRLGEPVWRGTLAAASPLGLRIPAAEACEYLLVVRGVFGYSVSGRQDALRRWHEPLAADHEPFCTACGVDELEALVAFVIDDKPRRPLAECPLAHAFVYRVSPVDGSIHVAINDYSISFDQPRYEDNVGALELELYVATAEHELLARYADPDQIFGVAVGPTLGAQQFGFAPGATPLLMLLTFPDLATFLHEVTWPTRPGHSYLLEVRGFVTAQRGVEADALFMWPPLTMSPWPLAIEGCSYLLVGTDAYAHRSAYELVSCGPTVTVRTTIARPAGVLSAELYER